MLECIVGALGRERFLAEHYLVSPVMVPGGAESCIGLASDPVLLRMLADPRADITLLRESRQVPGRPEALADLLGAPAGGMAVVFRHAERHVIDLQPLATALSAEFEGVSDVQLFLSGPAASSFPWHVDAEEVFVLQAVGRKRYLLKQNLTCPHPLPGAMPRSADADREPGPTLVFELAAGDMLYIPAGWWHVAEALTISRTIAVGVLAPSALTVLDALRRELLRDQRWRRRLPPPGALERPGAIAGVLAELHGEVARRRTAADSAADR